MAMTTILLMIACGPPKDRVPTTPASDSTEDLQGDQVLSAGTLSGANGYTSSGDVQLIFSADTQTYSLIFENFSSSNGPDLKVYLGTDSSATDFINLGDLKSTSGTLRYDFPASRFKSEFDTAIIWCERFSQLFGVADLRAP